MYFDIFYAYEYSSLTTKCRFMLYPKIIPAIVIMIAVFIAVL